MFVERSSFIVRWNMNKRNYAFITVRWPSGLRRRFCVYIIGGSIPVLINIFLKKLNVFFLEGICLSQWQEI